MDIKTLEKIIFPNITWEKKFDGLEYHCFYNKVLVAILYNPIYSTEDVFYINHPTSTLYNVLDCSKKFPNPEQGKDYIEKRIFKWIIGN